MPLRAWLVLACALALPSEGRSQATSSESQSAGFESAQKSHAIVSADILKQPISYKTHRMLQLAVKWMRSGDHQ